VDDEIDVIERDQGIALARRQIEALDETLRNLSSKRDAIANYITALSGEPVLPTPILVEAGGSSNPKEAEDERIKRAYPSRAYNRKIVATALEIIEREGKPMNAPEIHLVHPHNEEIGTEALYRLIYNRVISGQLLSLEGAFWPVDRPIPEGWDISMAKRKPKQLPKRRAGRAKTNTD